MCKNRTKLGSKPQNYTYLKIRDHYGPETSVITVQSWNMSQTRQTVQEVKSSYWALWCQKGQKISTNRAKSCRKYPKLHKNR